MILRESEALILRTHKLAEADKIVVFYSRSSGLVRGVARGARRLKSRFGAGLEPFSRVSVIWVEKEERELVTIRQVEIKRSYFSLSQIPEVVRTLEQIAAHTIWFAQPHQPDERLFRMITACVEALNVRPEVSEVLTTYFELWILKLSGFLPDLTSCGQCGSRLSGGKFDIRIGQDGVLFCSCYSASSFPSISWETVDILISFRRESPQRWAELLLRKNKAVRQQAASYSASLISLYEALPYNRDKRGIVCVG